MENIINIGKLSKNGKDILLIEKENGCMECISHCKDNCGYTRIRHKGKHDRLFRVLYIIKYGELSNDAVIRHVCDNPFCCNTEHLISGTRMDNVQDMIDRKRDKFGSEEMKNYGSKNGSSKLTEKQVTEIFQSKLSRRELAEEYGVSKTTISNIKNGKLWSWLTHALVAEIVSGARLQTERRGCEHLLRLQENI